MGNADLSDPNLQPPDWIVQVPLERRASAGARSSTFAAVPAGETGVLCATGTYPALTFHDGGTFNLGG